MVHTVPGLRCSLHRLHTDLEAWLQVPASAILDAGEPLAAVNADVIGAIHQHFGSTPEMCVTDTGIDETLLSYMRAAVAPARQLYEAGWSAGAASHSDDAGLDTMAQLQDPVDFNTEAKVQLCSICSALAAYCATTA